MPNRYQMMETIQPGLINTGVQSALNATQGHKPSCQQAVYVTPKWWGLLSTCVIETEFQDYSLAFNSTGLLYKLRFISLVQIIIWALTG